MGTTLPIISGIQQIGIGNNDVYGTWNWYKKNLGMDVPIFDEAAEAALMLPYTGGEPRSRHAILALNMMGGAGAEIWQYTCREALPPETELQIGDLGINMAIYKSIDLYQSHKVLSEDNICSSILPYIDQRRCFYTKDLDGNLIKFVESLDWFQRHRFHCGGVYGAVIGVSNMDTSIDFYRNILGYDKILRDETISLPSFVSVTGNEKYRSVVITHEKDRKGAFSPLLGRSEIELIQCIDREGQAIFKNRMWGDLGYIHLCFDINGMDELRNKCQDYGSSFRVDSGDFDMGDAGGQFAYIEDPDGTLIEFVETHRVPILKKIGWFLNLKNRDPEKPLPRWMLRAMGLNRKK
jgi:catechol 2,3-dioxygenase-like lactoylglutathione lyase family enzyme